MFSMLTYTMELCGPILTSKETHFWDAVALQHRNFSLPDYFKFFPKPNCLDASPNHLSIPLVPYILGQSMPITVRPAVKLIAVLREPIARELSLYNHERANGYDWWVAPGICSASGSETFEQFANCQLASYRTLNVSIAQYDDAQRVLFREFLYGIWKGLYVPHLDAWRRSFSRRQLYVMSYDTLSTPEEMATNLAKFLGLYPLERKVWLPARNTQKRERREYTKQYTITCAIRDDLQAVFEPWNDRLYRTLRVDQQLALAPEHEPPFPEFGLHPCDDARLS
ncbi:hypothetical protein CTAYLR_001498 [Chrysophaeum taylorii]|uniref:Sulfotransferase domain-containing protein n=1 Tax=Chrysophaeum taylorii TaxID=2483200 RepID=A0AAD7XIL3_9STRA|nr:hypothetical protein CTAYLR_001498 [Chrysophaeum taylorii]